MAAEVFCRRENKYVIHNEAVFSKLQTCLSEFMPPDIGNGSSYTITNLYYDTDDDYLIRTSISKPAYKEKLRLRAYGVPGMDSTVYVEIKKKISGVVSKRRCKMTLEEAYNFLETGRMPESWTYINRQVLSEIEALTGRYSVKPALYLSYDRLAFGENRQDSVRVTFDTNIVTRRADLRLEAGSFGEKLLPDETWIMEIKAKYNMPLWLSKLLSEYKIYPVSFSKYGTEYKSTMAENQKVFFIPPPATIGIPGGFTVPIAEERRVSHA